MEQQVDREIEAMVALSRAMAPFSDEDRPTVQRILAWFNSKYGFPPPAVAAVYSLPSASGQNATSNPGPGLEYQTPAEFYDAVSPDLEYEKALAMGYWFQVCQNQDGFTSQAVNTELKQLGHGVGNITDCFNTAIGRKPALVMQTQKSGSSKQARKVYKLTTAGIRWVESRLKDPASNERKEVE